MSDQDERRDAETTALAAISEHLRQVQAIIARLRERGVTSEELGRVHERAVEGDLWVKRHGHRGRIVE